MDENLKYVPKTDWPAYCEGFEHGWDSREAMIDSHEKSAEPMVPAAPDPKFSAADRKFLKDMKVAL